MSTRTEDIGRIVAEDPRVKSGQMNEDEVRLLRAMAELRQADPFRPEDMPGAPRGLGRLVAEFGRGMEGGLTFGISERSRDQILDPRQASPRREDESLPAYLARAVKEGADWTDVAAGLGYIVGSVPSVLATGGLAQIGVRTAAPRLLTSNSAAARALGKIAQYLASPVDEGASLIARAVHGGSREVYEGMAYSLTSAGARALFDDDVEIARELEEARAGAGLDFLLGAALGRYGRTAGDDVADIVGQLRRRLARSDNDLDRQMLEAAELHLARASQARGRPLPEPSEEALDRASFVARRHELPDPMSARVVGVRRAEQMVEGERGMGPSLLETPLEPLPRPVETIEERIARLTAEPEPVEPRLIVPGEALRSRERPPVGVNREGVDPAAALRAEAEADPMSNLAVAVRRAYGADRMAAPVEEAATAPLERWLPSATDVAMRRGGALLDESRAAVAQAERMVPRADIGGPATVPTTPALLDPFGRPLRGTAGEAPDIIPIARSADAPRAPGAGAQPAPEARMAAPEEAPAAPRAPEERLAAPEPEQPIAPRVRSQAAQDIASQVARATSTQEIAAAAANLGLVKNANEREVLAAFIQQRLEEVGEVAARPNAPRAAVTPARGAAQPTTRPEEVQARRDRTAQRLRAARRQRDEARRAAETDKLTGLGNSRAFERARAAVDESDEWEWIALDADGLKGLNDTLGHEAGNDLIRSIGEAVRSVSQRGFRTGGDEFMVAVPRGQAESIGRAIQEAVGRRPIGDTGLEAGVSFGVGKTAQDADEALVRVKAQRREAGQAYRDLSGERVRTSGGEEPERVVSAAPAPRPAAEAAEEAAGAAAPVGERVAGLDGAEGTTTFPDGRKVNTRYRLVPLQAVEPSHNPYTFEKNPRAVEGIQGRDYTTDKGAQQAMVRREAAFDESYPLDRTGATEHGPPIVRSDGAVVVGNDRTMTLIRVADRRPEAYAKYRDRLIERAGDYGLTPDEVRAAFESGPQILVREIADEGIDVSDRALLRSLNDASDTTTQKAKAVLDDAEARATKLQNARSALDHLTETIEPEQTLRAYLRTRAGREFVERLAGDGVISQAELSRFIDAAKGELTREGVDMVETMLQVAAVGRDAVRDAPPSVVAKMEHAFPSILQAQRATDQFSTSAVVREALEILSEVQANPAIKNVDDLLAQRSMFDAPRDPLAALLAKWLDGARKAEVTQAFRKLATEIDNFVRQTASDDLFGHVPTSPREAFLRIFGSEAAEATVRQMDEAAGRAAKEVIDAALEEGREGILKNRPGMALVPGPGDLSVAATEVAEMGIRAARSIATGATDIRRIAERWSMRATSWIERIGGEAGKELADGIRRISRDGGRNAKNDLLDVAPIFKGMTRAGRETLMKLVNGRISPENVPADYLKKAEAFRAIMDRAMTEGASLGMERLVGGRFRELRGSGKAYPQVPNAKGRRFLEDAARQGLAHPRVAAIADAMVRRGQAIDRQDALERMLAYREGMLRGVNSYLERSRFELPEDMIEWDPHRTLPSIIEKNWMTVEAVREWGVNLERADRLIGQIEAVSDPGNGRVIREFIGHHTGKGGFATGADRRLAGAVSNYETFVRLGFSMLSVLRNMGQRVTNLSTLPLSAQLRALRDYPPIINRWIKSAQQLREQVERTGAVRNRTALGDYQTGAPGESLVSAALHFFKEAETGNQITAALAARYALEADMKRLMRLQGEQSRLRRVVESLTTGALKPREAIERRVKRLGMTDEEIAEAIKKGGELTTEQIERAMHRMVEDTQFALTFATERVWWGTRPWARLMAQFKPFALEQTSFIYNQVVKEAVKGNVAPLIKFTMATLLVGEIYNIARDLLTGREESVTMGVLSGAEDKEIGARLINNLIDGGGLGMIADLTWGIGGWLAGPAGSSLENLATLITHTARRPSQLPLAVRQFVENEVSVTRQITPLVHRYLREDNDANRFFEHRKWRERAFRFRRDKEAPTLGAKATEMVVDAVSGRRSSFPVTDRTLSYQYAARAVTVGDVDGAAEYLAEVFRGLDQREFAEAVQAIRQSAASQSPLGPVAQEDLGEFLRGFSAKERAEARKLQQEWMRDYNRALRQAIREARR